MIGSWVEMFRALGQALIEVFKAELAEMSEELGVSAKHLGWALAFFGAAAFLTFWMLPAFMFLAGLVLAIWLPAWAAALIVVVFFLLVMAILGFLGYRRIRKLENPVETVRQRYDEHKEWWNDRLLPQEGTARGEFQERNREELT